MDVVLYLSFDRKEIKAYFYVFILSQINILNYCHMINGSTSITFSVNIFTLPQRSLVNYLKARYFCAEVLFDFLTTKFVSLNKLPKANFSKASQHLFIYFQNYLRTRCVSAQILPFLEMSGLFRSFATHKRPLVNLVQERIV